MARREAKFYWPLVLFLIELVNCTSLRSYLRRENLKCKRVSMWRFGKLLFVLLSELVDLVQLN